MLNVVETRTLLNIYYAHINNIENKSLLCQLKN